MIAVRRPAHKKLHGQEVRGVLALRNWRGLRVRDYLPTTKYDLCLLRPDWSAHLQVSVLRCLFRSDVIGPRSRCVTSSRAITLAAAYPSAD